MQNGGPVWRRRTLQGATVVSRRDSGSQRGSGGYRAPRSPDLLKDAFWVVLGLHYCMGFSPFAEEACPSVARRLLIVVAAPVEDGLWGMWASVTAAPRLQSTGSVAVAHGLSCSTASGTSPNQGIKPMSPVLAGTFFIADLPGKPLNLFESFSSPFYNNVNSTSSSGCYEDYIN